ncbi:uncharacterized protein LACBIDRAFT_299468 [Laccaria bicolor S238N-H82]|uniref:Predicted protein n=1 Tax=Laccaria bicolor (strain S238N-H82 / ATCC MYA-4686) TaxID=486041 RepID=B0DES2_LACBS|nr:uncharacterized protein LACBIDRAFT_299468 [Laccaria bicolor S238N-H82]EDR07076.1 predicted protein [Laccaria bicolor S238N-H82]|eukprot:XP_001882449.1 predicted protein [Laccaria bicolor S238N-H82]
MFTMAKWDRGPTEPKQPPLLPAQRPFHSCTKFLISAWLAKRSMTADRGWTDVVVLGHRHVSLTEHAKGGGTLCGLGVTQQLVYSSLMVWRGLWKW